VALGAKGLSVLERSEILFGFVLKRKGTTTNASTLWIYFTSFVLIRNSTKSCIVWLQIPTSTLKIYKKKKFLSMQPMVYAVNLGLEHYVRQTWSQIVQNIINHNICL